MGLLPYIRVNLRENYDCIYSGCCDLNNALTFIKMIFTTGDESCFGQARDDSASILFPQPSFAKKPRGLPRGGPSFAPNWLRRIPQKCPAPWCRELYYAKRRPDPLLQFFLTYNARRVRFAKRGFHKIDIFIHGKPRGERI